MSGETTYRVKVSRQNIADPQVEEALRRVEDAVAATAGVIVHIPGPTPATPGEAFVVPHGLGVTPAWLSMIDNGDQAGTIFADDQGDKSQWTPTTIVVRCSVGGETNLAIRLMAKPR
jgi:hypothetical protein